MNPEHSGVLAVRRGRRVNTEQLNAVVIDVDPTEDFRALAVLQAGLHEQPEGLRLVYGYDLGVVGLGAWIGDQIMRVRIWPALIDQSGEVVVDDHHHEDSDILSLDFKVGEQHDLLEELKACGRLVVAGPDIGPVPLVLDLDPTALANALDQTGPVT